MVLAYPQHLRWERFVTSDGAADPSGSDWASKDKERSNIFLLQDTWVPALRRFLAGFWFVLFIFLLPVGAAAVSLLSFVRMVEC